MTCLPEAIWRASADGSTRATTAFPSALSDRSATRWTSTRVRSPSSSAVRRGGRTSGHIGHGSPWPGCATRRPARSGRSTGGTGTSGSTCTTWSSQTRTSRAARRDRRRSDLHLLGLRDRRNRTCSDLNGGDRLRARHERHVAGVAAEDDHVIVGKTSNGCPHVGVGHSLACSSMDRCCHVRSRGVQ